LDYYVHVVQSLLVYRSVDIVLMSCDKERAMKAQQELNTLGRKSSYVDLLDINLDIEIFPYDVQKVYEAKTLKMSVSSGSEDFSHNSDSDKEELNLEGYKEENFLLQNDTLANLEENTLREIVDSVGRWIANFQKEGNSGHMPKTRSKLENAIKKLCVYRYGVDAKTLISLLHKEHLIAICKMCNTLFYPGKMQSGPDECAAMLAASKSDITNQPTNLPPPPGSILSLVLSQMKSWISSQNSLPTTTEGLTNHINSVKISHTISPNRVVQHLLDSDIVQLADEEKKTVGGSLFSIYSFGSSENISYTDLK